MAKDHYSEDEIADLVEKVDGNERRVQRDFWSTVRKAARAIPFMDEVIAAYYCALDRQTPLRVRAVLLGALAYFVLPIDAIPDFLALVGFSDDVTILLGVLTMLRTHITEEHRLRAKQALADVQVEKTDKADFTMAPDQV